MNRRRRLILGFSGALLAPRSSLAQQAGKIHQVGLLSVGTSTNPADQVNWQPFIDELRKLNYVEGRNLVLRREFGSSDFARLPELVANLVKNKVDVIVATGTREIRAAKQTTNAIPIVMTLAADPVKEGFVASLARPGGNVTGLTSLVPGLSQKYLELILEVVPSGKRFAVVSVPPNPITEIRREFESAAKSLGVELFFVQLPGSGDFDRALGQAKKDGATGIIHPLDGATWTNRSMLVQAALKHRLPGIYWSSAYVDDGGLMTYSINRAEQSRLAATVVDKILRGAKPADLPVQQPTRVELVINMKTARALGIKVPQSILLRADRLVE